MKTCDPIRARKPLRSSPFISTLACAAVSALLCLVPRAHAQLPNAWQITDASVATGSVLSYSTNLPSALQVVATNTGFDFSVNARLVTNYSSSTPTMYMAYGLGTHRFLIWFNLDTNGDLTAQLDSGGPTFILTTNGTGRTLYHTHEIVYDPTNGTASYLFDGQVITNNWPPSAYSWTAGQVVWGAGTSAGEAQMNFHRISFVVTNGVAAAYDAGTENNPTNAPDPVNQGWSLSPSPPPVGTSTNAISPDLVPLPISPAVTTLAAANVEPYQAVLSGVVNPGGLAANARFEWGTDTSYGNFTPPRFLPGDTNALHFSLILTGLTNGATYHFRCVAANSLGVVDGQDAVFTTPSGFSVTSLADSGYGSLRQDIADARPGDTITFATNGVIKLTSGELLITNNLTIAGPGSTNLAIDAGGNSRVMEITASNIVTLDSLTLTNGRDTMGGGGGGIFVYGGDALTISNCTLAGNSTLSGNGGGAMESFYSTVTLNNCTFSHNSATNGSGGSIYSYDGAYTLNNCILDNSTAGVGGGIGDFEGTIALNSCTLSHNSAPYGGGGIENDIGTLVANSSSFFSNTSTNGNGGGIGNIVTGYDIYDAVTNVLINCTLADNTGLQGGAIYDDATSNLLINCTLAGNSATNGGGIEIVSNSVTLTNTIVAGNFAPSGPNISGPFSGVYNLIGGNPLLAPLGNYGGPTQTMPPLFDSLAFDYGDDSVTSFLSTDQRGYPRKAGSHVDIGAVELQFAPANHPLRLMNAASSSTGGTNSFQFTFTNVPDADFTVLATTNVALPLADWIEIGNAVQNPPGQYQFTDPDATNYPQRFYQAVSP